MSNLAEAMRILDRDLDAARADGSIYTYGQVQRRIRAALDAASGDVVLADIAAELERHAAKGYTSEADDAQGALAIGRSAGHYLNRALAQGNRSDLIAAASLLIAAARTVDRLGSFDGTGGDVTR